MMKPQLIGIPGSPIKNGNTDRLAQAVLKSTGLETDFIKLSKFKVQSCIGCLGCTKDNKCKARDGFQEIAEKVKHVGARVVGGYPPIFTEHYLPYSA